jgi:hypothetical protein
VSTAPSVPPASGAPIFRVGRKLGRTVYVNETLIGIMESREWAKIVVEALNHIVWTTEPKSDG